MISVPNCTNNSDKLGSIQMYLFQKCVYIVMIFIPFFKWEMIFVQLFC